MTALVIFLQAAGGSGGYMQLILLVVMILVFWLFMIRPQTKKAKEQIFYLQSVVCFDRLHKFTVNKVEGKKSETPDIAVPKPEVKKTEEIVTVSKIETRKPETPVKKINKPRQKKKPDVSRATTKIENKNPDAIAYTYRVIPSGNRFSLKANTEILFGEKKVGLVRSVLTDSTKTVVGKFEMNKDFALYSNMDFFLFISSVSAPRLELRIDPTRKRELINPQFATISISLKVIN